MLSGYFCTYATGSNDSLTDYFWSLCFALQFDDITQEPIVPQRTGYVDNFALTSKPSVLKITRGTFQTHFHCILAQNWWNGGTVYVYLLLYLNCFLDPS